MDSYLERSIVRNIFTLTTETINVSQIADDLAENEVFSCQEREKIVRFLILNPKHVSYCPRRKVAAGYLQFMHGTCSVLIILAELQR